MNQIRRECDCDHGFPLCACVEGLDGPALLSRSRWLSSIAGWPGPITADGLAEVAKLRGGVATPVEPAGGARVDLSVAEPPSDCGCNEKKGS